MGGVIARTGAWPSLYPIPHPDSPYNPGLKDDSDRRPAYAVLSDDLGVGDDPRFIQPPPDALLFAPLALLSYHKAFWVWVIISCACAWGIAVLAGRFYELADGQPSRGPGAVTLLVAFSFITYNTLRALNMEAPIALLLALATLELLRRDSVNGACSLVLGALLKYAAIVLLPLAIALRRWRTLAWAALLLLAVVGISRWKMGSDPFLQYAKIFPLLSRAYEDPPNQSVVGLLMRLTGRVPLAAKWARGEQLVAAVAFGSLCVLIFHRFRRPATAPAVFAAGASLIGWILIFNPLVWNKYHLFLCPFWGWLIWEARQSRWRTAVVSLAIAGIALPWQFLGDLREPFNSHMLWAVIGMVGVGVVRLLD
jgi:hypothetical protein